MRTWFGRRLEQPAAFLKRTWNGAARAVRLGAVLVSLTACVPLATATPTATLPPTPTRAGPTGTLTPTIDWFPASATPTLAPTAASTPTPDQRPGLGEILLDDTFTDLKAWQSGRYAAGNVAYGDQELTLAVAAPKGTLTTFRSKPEVGDAYVEVTVQASLCRGSDAYGLLLRASPAPSYYRYLLSCDGKLRLDRVKDGSTLTLQDWTPYAGPSQPTRLGVWMSGSELRFFGDDRFQFAIKDPVLPSGTLGLFARAAGETALTVSFEELMVKKIE